MAPTPRWRISLCGPLQAVCGERRIVGFGSEKARALLAYLLLVSQPHTREKLVALFWPDLPAEAGNRRLRNALYDLRCAFAPDEVLLSNRLTVELCWERVEQEPLLGAGEPLEDIFESWAIGEGERLRQAREQLSLFQLPPRPLPLPPNRFIGREAELQQLTELLGSQRLVTITGPGGSGKTHLALELAHRSGLPCWFVALGELEQGEQLEGALQVALGLPVTPGSASGRPVREWLGRQDQGILLFDGAEHLLPDLGPRLLALQQAAPRLHFLLTSRQTLAVAGEAEFALDTLSLDESLEFFVSRARLVRPSFESDAHCQALCERLEGFPLALELAAAWMGILTPGQLLERLERTAQLPTLPAQGHSRYASLEAVFRHSYDALAPTLQSLLRALATLRGGWSLDAVEAICGATLQEIETLRRHSWVRFVPDREGVLRGTMLEILRQWVETLLTDDEAQRLGSRAAHYFTQKLQEQGLHPYSVSSQQAVRALAWCEQEQENLRWVLAFCQRSNRPEENHDGITMAIKLAPFWYIRGSLREGKEALQWAVGIATEPTLLAQVEAGLSWFCRTLGERDEALALAERGRARLPDQHPECALLWYRCGQIHSDRAQYEAAERCYAHAQTLWERHGEPQGLAMTRHNRAQDHYRQGDLRQAHQEASASLTLFQAAEDDWWTARVLNLLIGIEIEGGEYACALHYGQESERLHQQLRSLRGVAQSRRDRGQAHFYAGEFAVAVRLGEEARVLFEKVGDTGGLATAQTTLAVAYIFRGEPGDLERAESLLRQAGRACEQGGREALYNYVLLYRAELAARRGEPPLEWLHRALEGFRRAQEKIQIALCLEFIAEVVGNNDALAEAQALRKLTGAPPPLYTRERRLWLFPQ